MVQDMANNNDDPVFSVPGDLAINWWYGNNGARIALTGGHLSADVNDDNTHGLGNHFSMDGKTGTNGDDNWPHEISNVQDCLLSSCSKSQVKIQGTDHGSLLKSGPVYGNYAIYVSKKGQKFPINYKMLRLEMHNNFKNQEAARKWKNF